MCQAIDEGVWQSLCHGLLVVVVCLVLDVEHRLVDVSHAVPQQIHSHHWQGVLATSKHVVGVVVLHAEVLAEAQCLRLEPCLLQLYEDEMLRAVVAADARAEVYAQHRHPIALVVDILVWAHLHLYDVLFEQCREYGASYALVLHEVLKHHVVDRVCNCYHSLVVVITLQRNTLFP